MGIDEDIEAVMAAESQWHGSADQMWRRVEGEIDRRQQRRRWQGPIWGAAAAAVVLVLIFGAKTLPRSSTHTPPPIVGGEPMDPPPTFASPGLADESSAHAFTAYDTLPGFIYFQKGIVVGEVISETDFSIPPSEDAWKSYRDSQTPPPPDHPKAKGWQPSPPPKPMPAKRFTVKLSEVLKGSGLQAGSTITVQQLNVAYDDAVREPLLRVGQKYVLFLRQNQEGVHQMSAPYLALDEANRLRVVARSATASSDRYSLGGGPSYLRELDGVDVNEGLKKIRFAVRAETAITAALAKAGISNEERAVPESGIRFELWGFPRFVGTRGVCFSINGSSPTIRSQLESSVWPKPGGVSEVWLLRRTMVDGKEIETRWTFEVKPDGTVTGPVRSGAELQVSRCR